MTPNAINLLQQRYCQTNETPGDVYPRVAKSIANGDIKKQQKYNELLSNGDFLPNSPCLMNAGVKSKIGGQLKACYVLPVEDSIGNIFKTLMQSALIFRSGGGVGYNFSNLREKDAILSSGGTSSGVLSFMQIYDAATNAIKQGGRRKGASIGILDYDHPEILDFITEKIKHETMQNFNISVMVDDKFMKRIMKDDEVELISRKTNKTSKIVSAKDVFSMIVYSAWIHGDPGMLFFDRINKDNPLYPKEPIRATNPCGEVPLLPYESCNLGSINLTHYLTHDNDINTEKLEETVEITTEFLKDVNNLCKYPVEECYPATARTKRLGLGVMGYADMLIKMHIKYDSEEALKQIRKICNILKQSQKYSPDSIATLSIAPTGSLSILADCSASIEPLFATNLKRELTIGKIYEYRETNEYVRLAHDISPEWHIRVQSKWQEYIDNGVSKTINLSENASVNDVEEAYLLAYKLGCKGITVFRDKCRGGIQILHSCEGEECQL